MTSKFLAKRLAWVLITFLVLRMLSGCGTQNTLTPVGRVVSYSDFEALSEKYHQEMVSRKDDLELQISLPKEEFGQSEGIEVSLSLRNVSNENLVIRRPDAASASIGANTSGIEIPINPDELYFIITPLDPSIELIFPFPIGADSF